ncbi:uncharacterized protein BX663DRAFT_562972 [Cokeromyces recurvatus]|uniref:uncharacterized protein n=1 Tax=Cokeromyces recurvatus TaxID=90255 RepID=UPI002220CF8E|nr:uncharacterized protein BX663DRAFT_562972 [Cokeromyces recurvatus]KAI7900626.1 hypothetical protein BX663DRAFT_562972 [Cokeromyces recurvatus]
MNLPTEILNQIFPNIVSHKDRLTALTVCKRWYQSAFEAYYANQHDQNPGKYVKKMEIYTLNTDNKESITTDEFVRIAKYCPYLIELLFDDNHYWDHLSQLDFTQHWKYLCSLPFMHKKMDICYQLEDRLTSLKLCCFKNFEQDLLLLLSRMSKLKSIRLKDDIDVRLTEDIVEKLHLSLPSLQSLKFEMDIFPSSRDIKSLLPPLKMPWTNKGFQRLDCLVTDSSSIWFNIIKHNYHSIHHLVLTIKPSYKPNILFWPSKLSPENSNTYAYHIMELIRQTTIPLIHIHFPLFYTDIHFIQHFTLTLLNTHNLPVFSDHVSISFIYINDESPIRWISRGYQFKDSLVNRLTYHRSCKLNSNSIDHSFRFYIVMVKEITRTELFHLLKLIKYPINQKTTHLQIQRKVEHLHCFVDYVYLDFLLEHFPHVNEITISLQFSFLYEDYPMQLMNEYRTLLELSLLNDNPNCTYQYTSLQVLNLENIAINRYLYEFLFKHCPNISRLNIKHCQFDEQAFPLFNNMRTKRNMEVYIHD